MSWAQAIAYVGIIFGGWIIVGAILALMRASIKKDYPPADQRDSEKSSWRIVDLWLGGIERFIAMTLVIHAPPLLAPFIGWWTALKFASNWGWPNRKKNAAGSNFVFLVGTAISFGLAIWVGLCFNQEAINAWNNQDIEPVSLPASLEG